jgi:hypothetical protein
MSREVQGVAQLQFIGTLLNVLSPAQGDQASAPWGVAVPAISLSSGVEDDQVNRAISKRSIQLQSGSQLIIDLFDLVGFDQGATDGRDLNGQLYANDELNGMLVVLAAGSPGTLKIGGEGSSACWNSLFDGNDNAKILIRATAVNPGIFFVLNPSVNGYDVVDGSNHLLKFEAVGGSVDFGLFGIGRDNP